MFPYITFFHMGMTGDRNEQTFCLYTTVMSNRKVLACRRCQVDAELVEQDSGPDLARWPRCRQSERLDAAMREAAQEFAQREVDSMLRNVARRSEFLDYKPDRRPQRQSLFILR